MGIFNGPYKVWKHVININKKSRSVTLKKNENYH